MKVDCPNQQAIRLDQFGIDNDFIIIKNIPHNRSLKIRKAACSIIIYDAALDGGGSGTKNVSVSEAFHACERIEVPEKCQQLVQVLHIFIISSPRGETDNISQGFIRAVRAEALLK